MIATTLPINLEPADVEYWPADKVRVLQEERLMDAVMRAGRSALYAGRLPRPHKLAEPVDLSRLPYTTGSDLLRAIHSHLRRLAVAPVYLWLTSASGTERKWIPYGAADLLRGMGVAARLNRLLGAQKGEAVLFVSQPAPLYPSSLPYMWLYGDRWGSGLQQELIAGNLEMAEHNNWPEFAARRHPAMLVSRPGDAVRLAELYRSRVGEPREVLPGLRRGLFHGEPLAERRIQIEGAFGLEAFGSYASAEYPCYACECPAHAGLHLWADLAVTEIIPDVELEAQKANRRHVPEAIRLDEAQPGATGELVISTFSEALPLLRYRTGDRIRLVGADTCACGRTHPRIEVLGRES